MNVILSGACGKMGVEVKKLLDEGNRGFSLVAGVDPLADGGDKRIVKTFADVRADADVIIDFSHHSCTKELCEYAVERKLPTVVATTGQTDGEKAMIAAAARHIPIFFSANMSLGVAMLCDFARRAAALMPDADIEIVETHHNGKLDAPSGTALTIAEEIKKSRPNAELILGRNGHAKRNKNEIGVHALRLGGIIGEHEVILCTERETVTLSHKAHTRALFAEGALVAAEFTVSAAAGLYDMHAIVERERK